MWSPNVVLEKSGFKYKLNITGVHLYRSVYGEDTRVPEEQHRHAARLCQTLSHNACTVKSVNKGHCREPNLKMCHL